MTRKLRLCFACAAGITAASTTAASADTPTPPPTPVDTPAPPRPADPTTPTPTQTDPVPTTPAPPPAPTPTTPTPPSEQPTDTTTVVTPPAAATTTNTTTVVPAGVAAQAPVRTVVVEPDAYSYAWVEPRLPSQFGVGIMVGGGVAGFTDRAMRDTTNNVGGMWDAKLTLGTHIPIGIDLAYVGSDQNLSTIGGISNGQLIGTTVEGAVRFNILPHQIIDPYVFAGVGWQRYDVQNVRFSQADTGLKSSDSFAEFPMGAGISWRDFSGLTIDLRGTYRHASDSTLVLDPVTGNYAALHSWEASGGIGYEF